SATEHCAIHRAEDPEDDSEHDQADSDRPQEADAEHKAENQKDYAEQNHLTPPGLGTIELSPPGSFSKRARKAQGCDHKEGGFACNCRRCTSCSSTRSQTSTVPGRS